MRVSSAYVKRSECGASLLLLLGTYVTHGTYVADPQSRKGDREVARGEPIAPGALKTGAIFSNQNSEPISRRVFALPQMGFSC
jgi:hypothetical protein